VTEDSDDVGREEILERIDELREMIGAEEELQPMAPDRAIELWFGQLDDPADSTVQSYHYRLDPLEEFFEEKGIDDLNDLTPRDVKEFEAERRVAVDKQSTLKTQLGTIRQFLAYCYDLQAVTADVAEALNVPTLSKDERVNTEKLSAKRAEPILQNLDRYRYASAEHVMFLLLWRTCCRIGALRSLDLGDLYLEAGDRERLRSELEEEGIHPDAVEEVMKDVELPIVWFRHRPAYGTPLKNRRDGERVVNISEDTAVVLQDYIEVNRPDLRDDWGREPLLTTRSGTGRRSTSNIRNWMYVLTQPCEFGAECPHDRDPEECEAREHGHGSKCPSSRSPHKLRTGSITDHRDRGWSIEDIAEKANAGERLIREVYDQPNELLRAGARRENLGVDRRSDS